MRLPSFTKNFFFITGALFFVWMLIFDGNDLINQYRLTRQLNQLEAEKEFYQEKIVEVEEQREKLNNNPAMLEKYAREKYLMKKPTEDIYVVVTEDNN